MSKIEKEEVKCGCCDKPVNKEPELFCFGCKKYICDRDTCGASVMGIGHKAWTHKPCDQCGESVNYPGAASCASCDG